MCSEADDNGLQDGGKSDGGASVSLRPGDPGYVNRARVPQLSTTIYVVRPKWKTQMGGDAALEDDSCGNKESGVSHTTIPTTTTTITTTTTSKRLRTDHSGAKASISKASRLEKTIGALAKSAASRRKGHYSRAVTISLDGRNL